MAKKRNIRMMSDSDKRIWEKPAKSMLTDDEWEYICTFFDANGRLCVNDEKVLREYLVRMSEKYGTTDELQKRCPVCGNKKTLLHAWCMSCEVDFFLRKEIRVCYRRISKEKVCLLCGEREAKTVGLCLPCYRKRYTEYSKDVKRVIEAAKMLEDESAEKEKFELKKVKW